MQVDAVAALLEGLASGASSSSSIQPLRQAISSRQPILVPCRASMTWTNWLASSRPWKVPVSNQAVPRGSTLTVQVAAGEVGVVDRGDLQLAPGAGLEGPGDVDDVVVVEVEAGHGVAGLRAARGFSSIERTVPSSSNSTTP